MKSAKLIGEQMKKIRIKFLNWLLRVAGNHQAARKAATALLVAETLGISWYNPLWHLRNSTVIWQRLWVTLKREMRGYRKAIPHPNPNVRICGDFVCRRGEEQGCQKGKYVAECFVNCFGIRRDESGKIVPAWLDFQGKPDWIELGCRECKFYLSACKGIAPLQPAAFESVER
jgi:hypothetical protein